MPIFIQEDVRRLKGKEVQESPRAPEVVPQHHFIMDGMTFTGCTLTALYHGNCDLYRVYPYVITGNPSVLKPRQQDNEPSTTLLTSAGRGSESDHTPPSADSNTQWGQGVGGFPPWA